MPRRQPSSTRPDQEAGSGLDSVRRPMNRLFSGRSRVSSVRERVADVPESPKSPSPVLGLLNLPSTRLNIPYLTRTNTNTSTRTSPPLDSPRSLRNPLTPTRSRTSRPSTSQRRNDLPPMPSIPPEMQQSPGRRFVGVDPAELHLAALADAGRRRRGHKARGNARGCGPHIKNRKIRAKLLSCFISGLFLTLVLTIYLALALSNRDESQEFHVLLILIILIITVFFCHSLIRLCMMIIHPPPDDRAPRLMPDMIGPGGFANPTVPIRVALARDEEAAGIESEATKFPPPAYGLWRESVRVDPNRLYWQRNEQASQNSNTATPSESRPATARPPSYVSDNGVDYILEAAPRSIAPTQDIPLPPHPSERGRLPVQVWPMPSLS